MSTSPTTPYDGICPPSALDRSLDRAITAANDAFAEAYATNPAIAAEIDANAVRWNALLAAEEAAGGHGAVVPLAMAKAVLAIAEGTYEGPFSREAMLGSFRSAVERAERRA